MLPGPLSIDLAKQKGVSEIVSAATIKKGNYTSVVVTIDYTNALIVADDGTTLSGVAPTAQNVNAESIGKVTLTLNFDAANPPVVSKNSTSQGALDFRLSAGEPIRPYGHDHPADDCKFAGDRLVAAAPARPVIERGYDEQRLHEWH